MQLKLYRPQARPSAGFAKPGEKNRHDEKKATARECHIMSRITDVPEIRNAGEAASQTIKAMA